MANEITLTVGMRLINGLLRVTPEQITRRFNQTTARGGGPGVVDVGTSAENISFGDIVPGYVWAINLDTTNFVHLRFSSGDNGPLLRANGGMALFEMPSAVTLAAIADTATCKVWFMGLNI